MCQLSLLKQGICLKNFYQFIIGLQVKLFYCNFFSYNKDLYLYNQVYCLFKGVQQICLFLSLQHELHCLNSQKYKRLSGWLQMLQTLVEESYSRVDRGDPHTTAIVDQWERELDQLKWATLLYFFYSSRELDQLDFEFNID